MPGEPPASVAAVTARRVDCLQLVEIEFGDRLKFVGQARFDLHSDPSAFAGAAVAGDFGSRR